MNKLFGTLAYVCIHEPVPAYVKAGMPPKPNEWKASLVISDKVQLKAFKKFSDGIDAKASIKEYDDKEEFESKLKMPWPEDAGDEVWVVTLRKSTELGKTGKPVSEMYRPRVFEEVGNKHVEITHSKLVGNGSKGWVSIERFDRDNGTSSLYLKNVLVTELIEYVKAESTYVPGSEFGDSEPEEVAVEKAPAKAAKKAVKPQVEEEEDAPF